MRARVTALPSITVCRAPRQQASFHTNQRVAMATLRALGPSGGYAHSIVPAAARGGVAQLQQGSFKRGVSGTLINDVSDGKRLQSAGPSFEAHTMAVYANNATVGNRHDVTGRAIVVVPRSIVVADAPERPRYIVNLPFPPNVWSGVPIDQGTQSIACTLNTLNALTLDTALLNKSAPAYHVHGDHMRPADALAGLVHAVFVGGAPSYGDGNNANGVDPFNDTAQLSVFMRRRVRSTREFFMVDATRPVRETDAGVPFVAFEKQCKRLAGLYVIVAQCDVVIDTERWSDVRASLVNDTSSRYPAQVAAFVDEAMRRYGSAQYVHVPLWLPVASLTWFKAAMIDPALVFPGVASRAARGDPSGLAVYSTGTFVPVGVTCDSSNGPNMYSPRGGPSEGTILPVDSVRKLVFDGTMAFSRADYGISMSTTRAPPVIVMRAPALGATGGGGYTHVPAGPRRTTHDASSRVPVHVALFGTDELDSSTRSSSAITHNTADAVSPPPRLFATRDAGGTGASSSLSSSSAASSSSSSSSGAASSSSSSRSTSASSASSSVTASGAPGTLPGVTSTARVPDNVHGGAPSGATHDQPARPSDETHRRRSKSASAVRSTNRSATPAALGTDDPQ